MDFITSMEISASGLSAQRTRLNVISQNLANAFTTRTAEGGPYRRQITVFSAAPFASQLERAMDQPGSLLEAGARRGVMVNEVKSDPSPFKRVYDPGHPDADEQGYVNLPNVEIHTEMVNMITAQRTYDANVTAVTTSKNLAIKALEIGR